MAFDDATRGRLQRFVGAVRALLAEEFTRQLQQDYGLDPSTGDVAALDGLADHDDRRLETARVYAETSRITSQQMGRPAQPTLAPSSTVSSASRPLPSSIGSPHSA